LKKWKEKGFALFLATDARRVTAIHRLEALAATTDATRIGTVTTCVVHVHTGLLFVNGSIVLVIDTVIVNCVTHHRRVAHALSFCSDLGVFVT
jgi:hypothetical protein